MKTMNNLVKGSVIRTLTVIFFMAAVMACQKMEKWEPTKPSATNGWDKNGYHLNVNLQISADTSIAYKLVNFTISVTDANHNVIPGVNFIFGDNTSTIGGEVMHAYQATGLYPLTAIVPGGTTFNEFMRVLPFGQYNGDLVVRQIYHNYSGGICYDTIGLNVEYIAGYLSPGIYGLVGDFNGWPNPINAFALTQTRTIEGHLYALWPIQHALGLEKCLHLKNFTGGGYAYAYAPNSNYWHTTTGNNGELWIYFTANGISPTPGGSNPYPGAWGDTDPTNWIFRGDCTYDNTTANVTFYVNKAAVSNPVSPQFYYSLNGGLVWNHSALTETTDYYSYEVSNVGYETLVYFYVLAQTGTPTSKVAGGVMYNSTTDCCLIQIKKPF